MSCHLPLQEILQQAQSNYVYCIEANIRRTASTTRLFAQGTCLLIRWSGLFWKPERWRKNEEDHDE
jgi:hypothetical protein